MERASTITYLKGETTGTEPEGRGRRVPVQGRSRRPPLQYLVYATTGGTQRTAL